MRARLRRPRRTQPARVITHEAPDAVQEGAPPSRLLERLIFLSDGVFAIAMTLLVVDLAVPEVEAGDPAALVTALHSLSPKYTSFAISFVVIATYWTSHQRIFSFIVRCDSRLVWLNLWLLLCIAFQPFPTSVLGTYGTTPAVTFYAATLCVTGLVLLALWLYASINHRLIRPDLDARQIEYFTVRAASAPVVFAISIGIAQVDPDVAKLSWLAIAAVMGGLRVIYRHVR